MKKPENQLDTDVYIYSAVILFIVITLVVTGLMLIAVRVGGIL